MIYKTSLDKLAKGVTIGITIVFAFVIIILCSIIKETGTVIPICIIILLLLIYFIVFAYRPINYVVSADSIIIHRPVLDVKISRDTIKSVELLDKEKMYGVIRTFGVGGLFGYYGQFYNSKIGSMTWYATRQNNTVLVRTIDNKNIVLTPDEPEKFVANFVT